MKTAAIYTRVSSDQQKENRTIDSQVDELLHFAEEQGCVVPEEYIFKDEGYSGAILVRPGLEKVRDLSAEGQIQAVLIYSPDRLRRNYAYQVVLMDEFASCGTEVLFINSPKADTPEEALLLQFQGMISEYERAIIKERSRRGKRFKAKSGVVSVLCGAPYGYNYIRKTENTAACYQINEQEALVVKEMFRMYTEDFCSIGAVARKFTAEKIPTRKNTGRWERSVIWAMLRNPAYCGKACYGKTEHAERQRITELQKRVNTTEKELENLKNHELALDQRLQYLDAQSFTSQLGVNVNQLDIKEKKKILRLLVKEVVVGDDIIDIRHSIPLKEAKNEQNEKNYQLCTKSVNTTLRCAFCSCRYASIFLLNSCLQLSLYIHQHPLFLCMLLQ